MTPWSTAITKLKSDDGFWEIQDPQYQIGTEVEVDLDSRETRKFINRPTGTEFQCEIVWAVNSGPAGERQFFPTELLDL